MSTFLCQCKDIDGKDDWFAITGALDAEHAAEQYIERCESMSGGEMLNDPNRDREFVTVKDERGIITTFEISVDFTKVFYATELKTTEATVQ